MSSYANFYLRVNEIFVPLSNWSRNSAMYRTVAPNAPHEKIAPVTDFSFWIRELDTYAKSSETAIKNCEEHISMVMNAAGTPMEEKLEVVRSIEREIAEIQEEKEEYEAAAAVLRTYWEIYDNYEHLDTGLMNDKEHFIYLGIECPGLMEYATE